MPIVERSEEALDTLYGKWLDRLFLRDVEVRSVDHAELCAVVVRRVTSDGQGEEL